jgi:hypothetical protein
MANLRVTLGAVFGAVVSSADAVTGALGAVNAGVGMLNRSVNDAAENQAVRSNYDKKVFAATVRQEKARELTTSRVEIKKFMSQSADHEQLFALAFDELGDEGDVTFAQTQQRQLRAA